MKAYALMRFPDATDVHVIDHNINEFTDLYIILVNFTRNRCNAIYFKQQTIVH